MSLESRVQAIGIELLGLVRGERPSLFSSERWTADVLEWAMKNPDFKTELFRLVDVYPVLDSPEAIGRHIEEYLLRPGLESPSVIRLALKGAGLTAFTTRMAASQIGKNLTKMAERFIVGVTPEEALDPLLQFRKSGSSYSVDLLGETVVGVTEAARYRDAVLKAIDTLTEAAAGWPASPRLDADELGPLPRVNVSVKLSALESQLTCVGFDRSVELGANALIPIFRHAKARGAAINVDMEHAATKDVLIAAFERALELPEFDGWTNAAIAMQAYLRSADEDVKGVIAWAKKHKRKITVRLVKGAYWDSETALARREGWPSPVWEHKVETDACFERVLDRLVDAHPHVRTAVGSHNVRSIAVAAALADARKLPRTAVEFQSLHGMAEPVRAALTQAGFRVRIYAPVGELIPGMAYLVRRLLENTSNSSWLRLGFVEMKKPDELLAPPVVQKPAKAPPKADTTFANEPLRDFSVDSVRATFAAAITRFDGNAVAMPVIAGKAEPTGRTVVSLDPSDGVTKIGVVHLGSVEQATRAVDTAKAAFAGWSRTPVAERAARVMALAARLRAVRDDLSARIIVEVGKPWAEADADVAEAIDFCEYYARQAVDLFAEKETMRVLGEQNHLSYVPRGVAAVIAPWNFPLAIMAGMSVAALVTGNTVVIKPAEQSALIAARFHTLALEAGIPAGVLQFVPGLGEEVGAALVRHPAVAMIAFTGSVPVGLDIWRAAADIHPGQRHLKRVVCEMGGKNAIIVDDDADLDEAVLGVVQSAFGYAGQKCSACSRVIVARRRYDVFVRRLTDAVASLRIGSARDPATRLGPVVDKTSQTRLLTTVAAARGRLTAVTPPPTAASNSGYFVPPTVFIDVPPNDPIAQDELFGPVLAVIPADSLDDAIAIANDTPYALTGGIYTRSPSSLARARQELHVGNLYINRPITGALVCRQPFGGMGMSGGGTKAGGPDYLLSFVDPRVVTENTMRHGFSPDVS